MAESTTVGCPSCGAKFRIPPEKLGRTFKCPKCAQPFVATAVAPAPPAAPPAAPAAPPAAPAAPSAPARVASSNAVSLDDPPPVRVPRPPKQPVVAAAPDPVDEPAYTPPPATYRSPGTAGPQPGSGIAIAALIFSLIGCLSPVGLVLGIVGLVKAKNGTAGGRGMSMAAVIISGVMLVLGILSLGIILPALNKARETANRVVCGSNMNHVGQAMATYGGTYNVYPPDLTTLAKTEHVDPKYFVCPDSKDTPAASADQIESGGHCSYVYTGKNLLFPAAPTNVMFENEADHNGDGGNVLNSYGSVQWQPKASFEPAFEAAKAAAALRTSAPKPVLRRY